MAAILVDDIVSEVLEWLAEDKKTLQKCSLVCKSWIVPSQRHIFNIFHFTIVLDRDYANYARRANILADSPHLAAYVQRVYISIGSAEDGLPLVPVLRMFTNARSFSFTTFSAALWMSLPEEFNRFVENIVALGTFEELYLDRWGFEPQQLNDLLRRCSPTLRTLHLRSLKIRETKAEIAPVELLGLREIYIHDWTSFPAHGTLKTSNVDIVGRRLHSGCDTTLRCQSLLKPGISAQASTWSFYIPLSECIGNENCSAVDFRELANLRRLCLTIECRFSRIAHVTPHYRTLSMSALGRMLLRAPTTHLRFLDIDFYCRYSPPEWVQDDWNHMAASLGPFLSAGTLLEKVTFMIDAGDDNVEYSMITSAMEERLRHLRPNTVVEFRTGHFRYRCRP